MQTKREAPVDPRPFTLDLYPDRYGSLAEARLAAGRRQQAGDRRSIAIYRGEQRVGLKRF